MFSLIIINQWGLAQEENSKEESGKGCVEIFSWRESGCSHLVITGNIFNSDNDEKIQAPCFLLYREALPVGNDQDQSTGQSNVIRNGEHNSCPEGNKCMGYSSALWLHKQQICLPCVFPHLLRPILGALVSKTAKCEVLRTCGDSEGYSNLILLFLSLFNAFRMPWRRHVGLVSFIPWPFRGLPGSLRTVKIQPRLLQQSSVAQWRSVRLHTGKRKSSTLQRLT